MCDNSHGRGAPRDAIKDSSGLTSQEAPRPSQGGACAQNTPNGANSQVPPTGIGNSSRCGHGPAGRCTFGVRSIVLVYLANRDALFGLLRRTLRDDALAADVLQDLALFAGRELVSELQSSPRSFLFGAACRLALAARRRRGTVAEVDDVVPLLSVAAAQYPQVASAMFSWLEPFTRTLR